MYHAFNKRLREYQTVIGLGGLSSKISRCALKLSRTLADLKENVLSSYLLHKSSNYVFLDQKNS